MRMSPARCGLSVTLLMGITAQTPAQISAVEGPIPVTPESQIYGAADVPGARLSINLTPFGYVEEEYFIRGKASVYRYSPAGPERTQADVPYVTRIVLRRPADPRRFSGVVHFEPIHPTQGATFSWLALNRYLMSRGDIYVALGVGDADSGNTRSPSYPGQTVPVGQAKVTKWFDPKRYEGLNWPAEDGIRWDVMTDVGLKLRSADADNPLRGLPVQAMIVGGWSWTGSLQQVFINDGFHERARLPGGKPVFDGYVVGVASPWNEPRVPVHNTEPVVPVGHPRRVLKPIDAPVIEFITELEVGMGPGRGPPVPDRDGPPGAYRLYELGGVIHVASLLDPTVSYPDMPNLTQLARRGYPAAQISSEPIHTCPMPQSDVPQGAFLRAAVDNMRRWVLEGKAPPRTGQLVWRDDDFVRDATGNILGGIRAAEFVVPLARYGRYAIKNTPGCEIGIGYPFNVRDELPSEELRRRYGSAQQFIRLYDREVDRLVKDRWLLQEDALRLKSKAREDAARQF